MVRFLFGFFVIHTYDGNCLPKNMHIDFSNYKNAVSWKKTADCVSLYFVLSELIFCETNFFSTG